MGENSGPRADIPLQDLDPKMTVFVEIIGEDIESGHSMIHDPDYAEPTGRYIEMTLERSIATADEFCCDCFTRVMFDVSKKLD
ncbi:hypothetical protein [Salinilacihabitans rarus]|uniref:hypothetical protein n=1 Tax=Salinilacihabitans rarus TaxID=2961596 RepID=UPI0020C8AFA5|nr:hypothetical protein [Salinilacihabitans rarus]